MTRFAIFLVATASACGLFPSLDGLGGSDASPGPDADKDVTELPDSPPDTSTNDVVSQPQYERIVTIVNDATSSLPAGYTIGVPFPQTEMQTAINAGKMRADLGDLRVRATKGERDRLVDAAPLASVVWFSLSAPIAAGATDTTYAITYGDPNAGAPPQNGAAVFDFYDDFTGSSIDTQKWMTQGTVSVGGGFVTLPASGLGAMTTVSLPPTTTVEFRAKITDPTSDPDTQSGFYYWLGFQHTGDFVADSPWSVWIARDKSIIGAEQESDGCPSDCSSPTSSQTTSFRDYGIERQPTQTIFSIDGAPSYTTTAAINDEAMSLMIRNYLVSSDLVVDWIRARPRTYPDPTVTLGGEQAF